ncbi:HAD family hydrolase [Amnibacterium flavum]|uniref:Hydrolase n=1 Tax=Amnibacterium flavum TaxID=2173173 RepID=A0A2V1HUB9_9MICO|nr:HAD family hydrolase [Amnibacterium flavum]PVZ96216.1 hydrolase [Amnibacterium flavum]
MTLLFVFDMDNVLYDYDWMARMRALSAASGIPVPVLRQRWWLDPTREMHAEAGGFDGPDHYLDTFRRTVGTGVSEADWVAARKSGMTALPDSIAAARRAGELGRVSLLTNNGPLVHKHLAHLAPDLVPIFGSELRASSFYGARKPDPLVFERMLESYDSPAADTFFADDLVENVAGAESVGITTHLFDGDAAAMRAAIEAFAESRGVTPAEG